MRLARVGVSKYRSIDQQAVFEVDDFTVLVGPNNQGKSNLLRAAVLAMQVIESWARLPERLATEVKLPLAEVLRDASFRLGRSDRQGRYVGYSWEADYPVFARGRRGVKSATEIRLDFELNEQEQIEYRRSTSVSTNEKLPILITLDAQSVSLSVYKRGPGRHQENAGSIARFVAERVELLHVPAVRTGRVAIEVAEAILESRRRQVLKSEEYRSLMDNLRVLDAEATTEVSGLLLESLKRFLPATEGVDLQVRSMPRAVALSDILIDDGVPTSISAKGDGVQSLVALALTLEWTNSRSTPDKHLVVAVEEPESHLHPGAVHELRKVLQGIAAKQQVIVTTHSQSLVNRAVLRHNVVVGDRSARPAASLSELREALGVRVSDALTAASVTVIGEGLHDEGTLPALVASRHPQIGEWIDDGRLMFESAGSGSKIFQRVHAARVLMIEPVVFLDGDSAGLSDVRRLIDEGHIDQTEVVQVSRDGNAPAEIEDLFLIDSYLDDLEQVIGFELRERQRGELSDGRSAAWSERLELILSRGGVPQPRQLVRQGKAALHGAIRARLARGEDVLKDSSIDLVDRLYEIVKRKISAVQ